MPRRYAPRNDDLISASLGIVVANALMAHNKCLRDLENRLKELERKFDIR